MGQKTTRLASRLLEFIAGTNRVPPRVADVSAHLHWDRVVRAWAERSDASHRLAG